MAIDMNSKKSRALNYVGKLLSGIVLAVLLMIAGACRKEAPALNGKDTKAFDSASPEIKAAWGTIVTASSSNDYTTAILSSRKLQAQGQLTPEQSKAVVDTMTAMNNQMTAAAIKGDPNALKSVEEIRKQWRSN